MEFKLASIFLPKNKMRRHNSYRKKGFDYSNSAYYFVTCVTKNRDRCFGKIKNRRIILSKNGKLVKKQWHWLEKQYPYIKSHAFIVMPDHIHGILEIERTKKITKIRNYEKSEISEYEFLYTLQPHLKIKSLSELIGAFKTTSSKIIHLEGYKDFGWQRSFHDHIIRNPTSYKLIKTYIWTNPFRWKN
ncbi:MAG: transposase [Bacteroidota bacterium]